MKAKSATLRTLLIAQILFKHTDENHKMTLNDINEYLRPYGLDCTIRCLKNTANAMRKMGIDVKNKIIYGGNGFWINNRTLNDKMINSIAFAVATIPNISKNRANEILTSLKPYAAEHQEHALSVVIESKHESKDSLCDAYSVIREAIYQKRRVLYHTEFVRYNHVSGKIEKRLSYNSLATPKCIYRVDNKLYMVCHNYTLRRIVAVDLDDIVDIKIATHSNLRKDETEIRDKLDKVNPWELILEENPKVVYAGSVTFRFKGKYLKEILKRFGEPCSPIKQDTQSVTEYTVPDTVITTETLFWLASLPDNGIRLKGPKELIQNVRGYYERITGVLTDARKRFLLWNALNK